MIPAFSVKNPVLINMLMILVIVAGAIAAANIPLESFPQVDLEFISIITLYAKASPSEVEKLVTIPIENEIKDMEEVEDMMSSAIEGRSITVLKLKAGAGDLDKIVIDVQNRVNRAKLPEAAEDPDVRKITPSFSVMSLSVSGDTAYEVLRKNAEALKEKLRDIDGVNSVAVAGMRDREIWVEVDPFEMRHHKLSLAQIMERLRDRNLNQPGGTVKGAAEEVIVRTVGEFEKTSDVSNVVLLSNRRGHTVPLSRVAEVTDTHEEPVTLGHVDGRRSINLVVEKTAAGNSIRIGNAVKKLVTDFQKKADPNVHVAVTRDGTKMIRARLNVLINNGVMGFGLVILVLYFFLAQRVSISTVVLILLGTIVAVGLILMLQEDLTATMAVCGIYGVSVLFIMLLDLHGRISLMAALGIPVSVLFALILMKEYGASLNMISMFGLIVVLGMLVDDGIVVTENVHRHMQMGKNRVQAAIDGSREVFWPVCAAIFTTLAAFLPMLLMEGIMGKFMMWIPIVVMFALLGSLVESFLVLPSHLADFGLPKVEHSKGEKGWFRGLRGFYTWLLTKALRRRYWFLGATVAAGLLFIGVGFRVLGFQLFPNAGMDRFMVRVKAPVGTKLEETEEILKRLQRQAMELPEEERESVQARVGETGRGAEREIATNIGELTVTLVDEDQRKRSGEEIIADFRRRMRPGKGVKVEFARGRHGPPTGPPVQVRIRGENTSEILGLAREMMEFLRRIPGVKDVQSDHDLGKAEEHIRINEATAKELGVDVRKVADTVRNAYDGGRATEIRKGDEDIDVIVRLAPQFRDDVRALLDLTVRREDGNLVPLRNVASIHRERGPAQINRFNAKRAITVTADVETDIVTSLEVNRKLQGEFETRGGDAIHLTFGGEEQDRERSMRSLIQALWIAILLIYLILGSLFRSFIQPFVVLCTIPLGLMGVIYGLLVHGQPFSLMAMIGVVALAGVVVNDSLVYLDFINRLRRAGVPRWQAIVRAGRQRLRPIILTTATTVVGLLPLMFQVGGSSTFLTPMAIALVWGLTFATFLLLLVIPALYAVVDDIARRFRKRSLP